MKKLLLRISLSFIMMSLAGCAANNVMKQDPIAMNNREVIELECKAANKLGCRYKGRLYPWNAWVEKKGYSSKQFVVKDVTQTGSTATVLVEER